MKNFNKVLNFNVFFYFQRNFYLVRLLEGYVGDATFFIITLEK